MPEQCLMEYGGFSISRGRCHVVFDRTLGRALVGDPRDNPGTSVTNAIEQVGLELQRALEIDVGDGGLYQFAPWDPRLRRSHVSRIEFRATAWSMPVWHDPDAGDEFVSVSLEVVSAYQPYELRMMRDLRVVNPLVRLRIDALGVRDAYDLIATVGTIEHISQRRFYYVDVEGGSSDKAVAAVREQLAAVIPRDRVQVTTPNAPLDQPGTLAH